MRSLLPLPIVLMTATIATAEGSDGFSVDGPFDIGGRFMNIASVPNHLGHSVFS